MNREIIPQNHDELFPHTKSKVIIDFINGLDAARDLNAVQQKRSSFIARIFDNLSGQSHARDTNIQDHLIHGLEACHQLINELTASNVLQGRAILDIRKSLQNTQINVANLAEITASEFKRIDNEINNKYTEFKKEIDDIKLLHKAESELNRWLRKWKNGHLQMLSPMARCYTILDALYWGDFGLYWLHGENSSVKCNLYEMLIDELSQRLQADFNSSRDTHIPRADWLKIVDNAQQEKIIELLRYQGDWSWNNPKFARLTFMATQWPALDMNEQRAHERNTYQLINIKRVSERMVQEMFEVRQ